MPHLPASRFRRIAKDIAIDATHRIALLPHLANNRAWRLPQHSARLNEPYADTVVRLCRDLLSPYPTRLGTVTGRRWAPAPEGPAREAEVRFYIVRVDTEPDNEGPGGRILWVPRAVLGLWLGCPEVKSVSVLVDGYLNGWLPDGPITLD
ncbi:hypothetical protein ACMA1D_23400 [Streptomyces sp. 796.1]|uniref:hypothetical protein n=1 Tax=Streptomyces sp. 796.1 TaxID=3163029 RepID=UPI0039C9E56C